jgi:hypothetical protein
LSQDALEDASNLAKTNFFELKKFFDLEYYNNDFAKLLESKNNEDAKLITMFNVLANFEYNDLKDILKKLYDSM